MKSNLKLFVIFADHLTNSRQSGDQAGVHDLESGGACT